jgi:hypothetical protein
MVCASVSGSTLEFCGHILRESGEVEQRLHVGSSSRQETIKACYANICMYVGYLSRPDRDRGNSSGSPLSLGDRRERGTNEEESEAQEGIFFLDVHQEEQRR